MTKDRKDILAQKATLKVLSAILEEQNGYTPEEIKAHKLAEACEGSELWDRVYKVVYNLIGKK